MGGKLQEEGVWAPKTPAKSLVCEDGKWKNHVGGNLLAGNSHGAGEFIDVSCSEYMNAARALKEGNGNNVFDLNKSADELDFGDSTDDCCADVLAGKQGGENSDQAYLDVTIGVETLLGGVCQMPNNLFLASHSQNDSSMDTPSLLTITQATSRAVVVDKMISSSPESHSDICNSKRIPGLLLESDEYLPSMKPKNNTDRQATPIHSFNKDGDFHDEKPKPSVTSTSTAVSTPSEKRNTRGRHKDDVNLNRQSRQKPRKKKYWPKVVGGKPKKTTKPGTPCPSTPKPRTPRLPKHVTPKKGSDKTRNPKASTKPSENFGVDGQTIGPRAEYQSGGICALRSRFSSDNNGRKDGKNNKLQASVKPLTVSVDGQIIDRSSDYVPNLCKRALNFDSSLQNHEKEYGKDAGIITCQNQQWKKKMDEPLHDRESIIQVIEGNELIIEKSADIAFCFNQTKNRIQSSILAAETGASNDPHAKNLTGCHYNFFKVYRRIFRPNQCLRNSRKLGPNFPRICKKKRMKRQKATKLLYFVAAEGRMETQNMTMHSSLQSSVATEDSQMITRAANDPHAKNPTSCHCNSLKIHQRIFQVNQCLHNSKNLGPNFRWICKKRRMRRRKAITSMCCRFGILYSNCAVPNSERGGISPIQHQTADNNPNSIKYELSLVPLSTSKKKRSNKSTRRLNLGPLTVRPSCNWLPSAPLRQTCNGRFWNLEVQHADNANMVTKSQIMLRFFVGNAASDQNGRKGCPKNVLPPIKSFQDEFSMAFRDVVERLQSLHISDEGVQLLVQNQNVVHKPVILFDSKKRKPPPKVDIDQETMRVWKLLMGNGGEVIEEENDKDKETWWEEQREVFRGRVDSFIARMHLVQGDRRFSPWKGSVVDSVVGVFLTQNVSDHLSSSAFLSLAAKYPIRSTTDHKACDQEGEVACSQESVGGNIGGEVKQELDATGNQSLVSDTELDTGHELVENKVKEAGGAISDEVEDSAVVQDEFLQQNFVDYLIHANSSGTCKLSVSERSSCSTENFEPACLQELGSSENVKLLSDESLIDCKILQKLENIEQGSNLERLPNANGTHNSMCSPGSLEPYSHVRLMPSDLEADSQDILEDFTNSKMKSVEDNSKNLGYMEPSVLETIIQQKVDPGLQEVTVYHCASSSKCQVLPECSSQDEVTLAKGWPMCEYHLGGSKTVQQTEIPLRKKQNKTEERQKNTIDWDDLRKTYAGGRTREAMDSLDWEGVRQATVDEVADTIKERGQHNMLAERIKDFLERVVREHGNINLEWLRDVPPDKAKEYLLSFKGLGLKSVECVRLLTLHHHAFPVDTNVGRVAVRLGWVPLQPLPESLQIHLLEQYPLLDTIQIYLWPRLCTLDQQTLYELHYHMITFGKVFCRKQKPNCNACPMRGECRHFASAFASARLSLPGPKERSTVSSMVPAAAFQNSDMDIAPATESLLGATFSESRDQMKNCEPIIEHPPSPEPDNTKILERDIEDFYAESEDDIPTIRLETEGLKEKIQEYIYENNIPLEEGNMSKALVALTSEAASIPKPKLKHVSRLRTVHLVYELPDSHPILAGLDKREPDDPSPYLLAIWTSGETTNSSKTSWKQCDYQDSELRNENMSFSCSNIQDQYFQTVCGTILIPCRTATRGRFPLNGTYFQVNEVFADDETSQQLINVPRAWIWNLRRRILYCGAYASAIFRGLSTAEIQNCFWKGFVCVRGFNRKTRAPAHLSKRFHISTSTPRGKTKFSQDK